MGTVLALALAVWLWMDCVGLLLSVISTYFYFGWEGVPLLTVWLLLISLFALSGPLLFRAVASKSRQVFQVFLGLQVLLYLGLSLIRHSHFFAWGVVCCAWFGGAAVIGLLQRLLRQGQARGAVYGVLWGYALFSVVRLSNQGMAALEWARSVPAAVVVVLCAGGSFFFLGQEPKEDAHSEESPKSPGWLFQLHGLAMGLLMGLSVGLIYNLPLWSTKASAPGANGAAFLLSLGLGLAMGVALVGAAWPRKELRIASIALSFGGVMMALRTILGEAMPGDLMALLWHTLGCAGLAAFWALFFHQSRELGEGRELPLPTAGLQIGITIFLLVLTVYLLFSNPAGFWLCLVLSSLVLALGAGMIQSPAESLGWGKVEGLSLAALAVVLALGAGLSMAPSQAAPKAKKASKFSVMTANIRYGWTDDYRFEPHRNARWIAKNAADLIGFQEFNKGHTSAGYMDLFQYYQSRLPGAWYYGDANFGFGNAIYSRFPVKKTRLLRFKASDLLRRSCLWALVEIQGKEVEFFVTHVSHKAPPNPIRIKQVAELRGHVAKTKRPWILLGDFNATPASKEIRSILPLVHPVFRAKPALLKEFSFSSLKPRKRIDYVFFSSHFRLHSHAVLDPKGATDHKPIRVVLSLKK